MAVVFIQPSFDFRRLCSKGRAQGALEENSASVLLSRLERPAVLTLAK